MSLFYINFGQTCRLQKSHDTKKSGWEDVLGSWGKGMTIYFYTIGPREKKCFLLLEISVTE